MSKWLIVKKDFYKSYYAGYDGYAAKRSRLSSTLIRAIHYAIKGIVIDVVDFSQWKKELPLEYLLGNRHG